MRVQPYKEVALPRQGGSPFHHHPQTKSSTMAPSAVETITSPGETERSTVKLTSNTGPYKELAPIGYEKSAEEEGKDAAKVSG